MSSLLPHNATPLELAVETEVRTVLATDVAIDTLWRTADCPLSLLPYLAWALSVDVWDADWPEALQRSVVAKAVHIHRTKGTVGAIRRALAAIELGVTISEWFEYGGDPYTFKADVMITTRPLTEDEFDNIVSVIANTKNARSHLSQLRVYLTGKNTNYFAVASLVGERIDIMPWVGTVPVSAPDSGFAIATHIAETITTGENFV